MAPFSKPSSRSLLVGSTAGLVRVPRKFSKLSLVLLAGLAEMFIMEYTLILLATVPATISSPYRSKAWTGLEGHLYWWRGLCSRSFHTVRVWSVDKLMTRFPSAAHKTHRRPQSESIMCVCTLTNTHTNPRSHPHTHALTLT